MTRAQVGRAGLAVAVPGLLALLYAPPLGWLARWGAHHHGVDERLLVATLHSETRGSVSARRVWATARQLAGADTTDATVRAQALAHRRFPRDEAAQGLLAEDILGGWRRGVAGHDRLGLGYTSEPAGGVTDWLVPGDTRARRGAAWARYLPASPGAHRERRGRVRAIVLHTSEGTAASAVAWFRRPGANVSAHYVVRSSDGAIIQLVDEDAVAFHDACFNETTIGIEHEGLGSEPGRWYTPALYEASARLVRDIARRHGLPLDRAHVLGHDEAPDCSEHDDPGPGWDWVSYERRLRAVDVGG